MKVIMCYWYVLFIILSCLWIVTGKSTIYVNQGKGRDEEKCLHGLEDYPCRSLDFVSTQTSYNSIIVQDDILLKKVVSFSGRNALEMNGAADHSVVITCDVKVENTGFHFSGIKNLTITGLEVQSCGYHGTNLTTFKETASMYIQSCVNVSLRSMIFQGKNSTSLVLSNTLGAVEIDSSSFQNSYFVPSELQNHLFYPGGVHIQLENVRNSTYSITNSNFSNNTRPLKLKHLPEISLRPTFSTEYGFGLGGGMGIIFRNSHGNSIVFQNCLFLDNKGHTGPGLYMHFEDDSSANIVSVLSSRFVDNKGLAGGGLTLGIGRLVEGAENYFNITGCEFVRNQADYGGGTAVVMIRSSFSTQNLKLISFSNSTWRNNSGPYSPAVDIMAFRNDQFNLGYLPTPYFSDCNFTDNSVNSNIKIFSTTHLSSGVFVVSSSAVYFGGIIEFANNRYTALKLTSASLHLERGARVYFDTNKGRYGGAVGLYGFSAIVGNDNCLLHFYNNFASILGGAIYYETIEQREFIEGKSCFLQNEGEVKSKFVVEFVNNSAVHGGTSIHSISFYSCFFGYFRDLKSTFDLEKFFDRIGTFIFEDSIDNKTALSTEGMNFSYAHTNNFTAVPGEELNISVSIRDELGRLTQSRLFLGRVDDESSTVIFTNNKSRVYGNCHESTFLSLRTENTIRNSYSFLPINFSECPPGFYFDPQEKRCQCIVNSIHDLFPIVNCSLDLYQAYILPGYWAGMVNLGNTTRLYVSSYARLVTSHNTTQQYPLLPKNVEDLEMFMCGAGQRGILCGRCSKNYSAFFHLPSHGCREEKYCHLGAIFYLLSELLPIVILFSIIIRFSAHLQIGSLNGFIFFCQVISAASVNLKRLDNLIPHTAGKVFCHLQELYSLVYDVFNFEFFAIEPLSFCMWYGAKVMDAISFKYITTLFTLALIVFLVRIMNSQSCRCCGRSLRVNFSVTSGLSAFLMLCYSQCTKITFQILNREKIISSKGELSVTAFGGIAYFGSQHLIYAIPALVCLCTVILLPLVYLLLIPLFVKLLSLCGKSEHPAVQKFLKMLCNQRWMPLFDAFQSCFKPNMRFFAGMYFAYRIAIYAVVTFSRNETQLNAVTELVFLLILGLHALAQPYKERINNMVDSFLFLNLAVINGLNILISTSAGEYDRGGNNLIVLIPIHILLVFVPMVGLVAWLGFLIYKAKKKTPPSNMLEETYDGVRSGSLQKSNMEDCASESLLDTY